MGAVAQLHRRFGLIGFISAAALPALAVRAALPVPDHVVIVIEENHSLDGIIGNPTAPYMNMLASTGANFTRLYAVSHPSEPNYLQFFSGSSQGVTDDTVPPPGAPYSTPNLGAALQSAGKSFTGYSEDLPSAGSTVSSSGNYVRRHNPWVNWQDSTVPLPANKLAPSTNQPFTVFPTNDAGFAALPTVSIVVPNLQNDMHDGTIAQADAWLQSHLEPYRAWAQTHNSLMIVTWDEDDHSENNRIPTFFNGPMVSNTTNDQPWTLHSLLRTVESMYGTAHSGNAANVLPINDAWTNEPGHLTKVFQKGLNGYSGTKDTYLDQTTPASSFGTAAQVVVDGSPVDQGLIRFDNIFAGSGGMIPAGAVITSARLSLFTGSSSASNDQSSSSMELHRMLKAWNETDTWNSLGGGLTAADMDAASAAIVPTQLSSIEDFDVTSTVQAWTNGATNFGWAVMPGGTDGWRWSSSDLATQDFRPMLTITYLPEPTIMTVIIGAPLLCIRKRRRR